MSQMIIVDLGPVQQFLGTFVYIPGHGDLPGRISRASCLSSSANANGLSGFMPNLFSTSYHSAFKLKHVSKPRSVILDPLVIIAIGSYVSVILFS